MVTAMDTTALDAAITVLGAAIFFGAGVLIGFGFVLIVRAFRR
jgi:hypothetical protein